MGVTLNRLGKYEVAIENLQKADEIPLKTVGEESPYTTGSKFHIANSYYKQKKYPKAEKTLKELPAIQRKVHPQGHFLIAFSQRLLGEIYTETGKLKIGETEIRKALNFLKKTVKAPNPDVAKIQTSLGKNLIAQKRFGEAKELLISALEASLKTKGEGHPDTKECRELLSKIQKRIFALRSESRL